MGIDRERITNAMPANKPSKTDRVSPPPLLDFFRFSFLHSFIILWLTLSSLSD